MNWDDPDTYCLADPDELEPTLTLTPMPKMSFAERVSYDEASVTKRSRWAVI